MPTASNDAWNNFLFLSRPQHHGHGTERWAAAVASRYMGAANNGGLNSFLTYSYEISSDDVLLALNHIGAGKAAAQLAQVLTGLGAPLQASTQDERWDALEQSWTDDLNALGNLSDESDTNLRQALERHVDRDADFYLRLR